MSKKSNSREDILADAIERMNAVLHVLVKGDDHRPDIIKSVIEVGEWALDQKGGE